MDIRLFLWRRKVRKLEKMISGKLHEAKDIIDVKAETELKDLIQELHAAGNGQSAGNKDILKEFSRRAEGLLPRQMTNSMRNILDLIAVVAMVACGIRGIFLQPFQIPTSSMQPTLYGIHEITGDAVPDNGLPDIVNRILFSARRENGRWISGGDHLFVDRVSIHVVPPRRGDVIVFTTNGIKTSDGADLSEVSGAFYIKRLIGLPGDTLRFTDNGVEIKPAGEDNFRHITEFASAFDKLYSGRGGYQKHSVFTAGGVRGWMPATAVQEVVVPENHYYMLGDNVAFSADSRFWGFVPGGNIVGRAFVVFWPFNRRWGLIDSREPLDVPTGRHNMKTFSSMSLQ